jgi:preprotein translocase subunit SecD
MSARNRVRLAFVGVLFLSALAAILVYPSGPDLRVGGWFKEVKVHLGLDLQGGTSLLYRADVSQIATEERAGALEGVRDVIERRINAFGVAEPNIQTVRSGDDWRVLVELPGVTDITEAINRIGATPLLEFKKEAPPKEFTEEEIAAIRERNAQVKTRAEELLQRALAGEDFSELAKANSEDPGSAESGGDLGEFGRDQMVAEFDQAVFDQAPVGAVYPELVETSFGYHIILVEDRHEVDTEATEPELVARARHILLQKESETPIQLGPNYEDTGLTGEQLDRADVTFDPNTGLPTVSLAFNNEGSELFAQITRENIGKSIAIYLDGEIISAPVVQQEITAGEAVITGDFTLDEARELAQRLNAGALPVPIELESQQNIGPSLGQASIERSIFAGLVGIVLLAFFMIVYYRLPGVFATVALAIYFLLVLAVFKLWPVTLSLAGIAGFILSIGIAVDANVLIFERFKEELRRGKAVGQAIDDGFRRAWSSIRDGNLSSLITCLILYWFGSSLIRGFAITLAIGIVVSMFSAITITRTFMHLGRTRNLWWYGVPNRSKSADKGADKSETTAPAQPR